MGKDVGVDEAYKRFDMVHRANAVLDSVDRTLLFRSCASCIEREDFSDHWGMGVRDLLNSRQ